MSGVQDLSREEVRAIAALQRLAKRWPQTLWIFAGSGRLVVLKVDANGQRAVTARGSVDQAFIVGAANIPSDGGDW